MGCPKKIREALEGAGWVEDSGLWYHASVGGCTWIDAVQYSLDWFAAHHPDAR